MNTEEKKKYFAEAALALNREGFRAEMFHGGKLSVWWDGEPLCEISDGGTVHYHNADLQTPERNEAKDRAYQIICTVFEYMYLMESAPPLKVADLSDRYKVLSDFNGTVLAAVQSSQGVQFVTWDWDFDRKGVSHGIITAGTIPEPSRISLPAPDLFPNSVFSARNNFFPSIVPARTHWGMAWI